METSHKLSLGDISVNFPRIILEVLESLGYKSGKLAQHFSLNREFLDTPNARISIPKYLRLGHDAIAASQRRDLGLLIGKKTATTDIGISGLAAMCAQTLERSLRFLIEHELLNSYNSRGSSQFKIEGSRAICQFYSISPYNEYNFFVVDAMLSTWWQFIQTHTNGRPECHHVEIEYDRPSYSNEIETFFGCPVHFNAARNALILKRGHHTLPLKSPCAATFKQMNAMCQTQMRKVTSEKPFTEQVVELISQNLTGNPPDIDTIGLKLGMAGWTLRRRLKKEGSNFQKILDDTRRALAQSYVLDTHHNFTEIAFLLGFASPSAFQRAFKRWTGNSPGEQRKQSLWTD